MALSNLIYRSFAWLKFQLSAANTLGHGIHSPKLFYMVESLFYDDNSYYSFSLIEKQRNRLLQASKVIYVDDYGTGKSGNKKISDIAKTSLKPPKEAQLIFRLVNYLKPQYVVELGTSLGITTAYLSFAAPKAKIITIEGSENIACEAKTVFEKLSINNITQVIGNIDTHLGEVLKQVQKDTINFFYVDANHAKMPTIRYFDALKMYANSESVFVFDDIHASKQMDEAWEYIKQDELVSTTIDTFSMGFVFFDPHFLKRHYKVKI